MTKTKKGMTALTIGALGVVFGDIGTSPLYAFQAAFGLRGHAISDTRHDVFGVISLIIWSITIVVSIKFIAFIMRYGNQGEGGIMALVALIKSSPLDKHRKGFFITLGLIGVCLFYGDGAITPAISVLSAVEGLKVVAPSLSSYIVPITVVILTGLFWVQRYGTGVVGRLFGPVMLIWFLVIALGGAWQIWQYPSVLQSLSPLTAISFFVSSPLIAFTAMTVVVLAITGAEALYADMGHFGRPPIARAWFLFVFPALTLCYMGQGAMILHSGSLNSNLLVQMFPVVTRVPIVILATVATVIASQSVISGTFSLTRQAIQLDYLPKMLVRYTSNNEIGQIYVPFINFALFLVVIALVILFGSANKLANAYGIAVSGTLLTDTILFIVVMKSLVRKPLRFLILITLAFLPLDLLFVSSNAQKILHGGIFPVAIAAVIFMVIKTWTKGESIVEAKRIAIEDPFQKFVDKIRTERIRRVPGEAIYIGHHSDLVPLALVATVEELHELPDKVTIVTIQNTTSAHVPNEQRAVVDELKHLDGISHITLFYGFHDVINIPKALAGLTNLNPELNFDLNKVAYFISSTKIVPSKRHNLANWRKSLYRLMARNALSNSDYYKLPTDRTEEMQTLIGL